MLKSIARLPFRLAKVIARKIQEEDAEFYEKHKAQYESRGKADSDEPLVCYCDDGSEALIATLFLRRRGFHQAWSLNGGLKAWKKSGAPTES